jgi:hypothetical protein
MKKIRLE